MIIANESLKPCPFCGSDGVMFEDLRYRNDPLDMWVVYGVKCSNKDCIMDQTQHYYPYESSARQAWNRRDTKENEK